MKKKYIVKAVIFASVFGVLLHQVSKVVTTPSDYRNYQWISGFYEEEEDSLDVVYVGSSNCYAFWNPMVAWEEYGITSYPYACNDQPFAVSEYLIEEIKKTQENPLFIFNINATSDATITTQKLHYLLDYMPFSMNKLAITKYLTDLGEFSLKDSLEFYFPIIRYHSRWSELVPEDFEYELEGIKGASSYSTYLSGMKNIEDEYVVSDKKEEPLEEVLIQVEELLDYCDKENVNILFVTVPRSENNEKRVGRLNAVTELIESRGYPTLNLLDSYDELGIDLATDYYDKVHLNIHGSIKYTHYLSEYLVENYGFKNKKEDTAHVSWQESWDKYQEMIKPYVFEWELDADHKAKDLKYPKNLKASVNGNEVEISFSKVKGADGYSIYYMEEDDIEWKKLADLNDTQYVIRNQESGKKYTYRVVPFYERNKEKYYGNYASKGVSAKIE